MLSTFLQFGFCFVSISAANRDLYGQFPGPASVLRVLDPAGITRVGLKKNILGTTKVGSLTFCKPIAPPNLRIINVLYRGYYMTARRYEISLRVLKNISRVSAATE